MKRIWVGLLGAPLIVTAALSAPPSKAAKAPDRAFDPKLPILGTQIALLPSGPGKEIAEAACLSCHSADILRQQRLTEAQWTASVKKMVGWGADVPEERKELLIKYLTSNFGPDNVRFEPVVTRPVGR